MNLGKQAKLRKFKISFWMEGTLLTIPDQLILSAILNDSHYWEWMIIGIFEVGHIW